MSEEIPEEWLQGMREELRQLFWQVELLTRDIARLSDASFGVNEWDSPYEGAVWHISFSVRNTAPLFPSELKALAHSRLPWATNVKVCIQPSPSEEPYLRVDLEASPLPPLSPFPPLSPSP